MMTPRIRAELAVERHCELGEGPQWHAAAGRLYWCDILARRLHWLAPSTGATGQHALDHRVSLAAPLAGGELLLVGEDRLSRFDPHGGRVEKLLDFEADNPVTRSNDGRVDRHGSLWLSSMGRAAEPGAGSLYRLHRGELTRLRTGLTIPNAICFSPDGESAWFTDTVTGVVMRWALDREGWPLGEPTHWADVSGTSGHPDGAVVDAEGYLWLALWGAGQVVRLDHDGHIVAEIELPVTQPSCPVFAGKNLERLYITTAREGLNDAALAAQPLAGALFVADVGVTGLAEPLLRLT
ncbi:MULTISPECIES: SMP-30/gluconolactonase/LRE family protein [unclassified Halomonas]|uniref:SMP-30/gluconolactonase/LRE family protein n=1 Tax=unclassified Halomonas TaxID=2609666 RepID=UPI0028837982|nr:MULTISPECIES: SMP-30/gluconolactonase/LRE family protein [unclassified Halomonas]MDT0500693.1 SMP-30/gluconolactonase/LRE family protein [Halomonas sp. PAR7]MDT0513116.1 SMP-30/gluconolactonase/LRE family protein [Halomonas sp. LES1]MDT0591473.1 SMP-30/gluconolactonase/LRE family protein [Halomonas sp. PAR8]